METRPRHSVRSDAAQVLPAVLERRLRSQPYLGGETPCATDLAIFPFVRQFAAVEPAWFGAQAYPNLKPWLAAWTGGDLFAACMTKLPTQTFVRFPALSG